MREKLKPGTKPTDGESRNERVTFSLTTNEFNILKEYADHLNQPIGYLAYKMVKEHIDNIIFLKTGEKSEDMIKAQLAKEAIDKFMDKVMKA